MIITLISSTTTTTTTTSIQDIAEGIGDPTQSRASLLGVFSSVYLLTTYVSRVDFSSFMKRNTLNTLSGLPPPPSLPPTSILTPSSYTAFEPPTYTFSNKPLTIDGHLLNSLISAIPIPTSFTIIAHVPKLKSWHIISTGTPVTISPLQVPPSDPYVTISAKGLGFLSKYQGPEARPQETYLPVFKNAPDKIEVEACVPRGAACVLMVPITPVKGKGGGEYVGNNEAMEVDSIVAVVAVGEEKYFTPKDIFRVQFVCANSLVQVGGVV